MKIKLLAAVLIWGCVFENTVFAQKEHNIWYFGNHAGVDFNSGVPVALTNSAMNQVEGCASIANANGNLLFYTNGITVWDHNHNQMPNGFGLAGGSSSTQSALIVPFPGNSTMYYIFTVGTWTPNPDFNYSVVDISLNGGNGNVTVKNQFITSPVCEKLTAVKHSNNTDIWVMVHELNSNNLNAYLVTAGGVASVPVTSTVGTSISGLDAQSYMKFAPDGSKLAFATSDSNYVEIFDFNTTSGTVTNEKHLPLPAVSGQDYGLEFSKDGHFLYCSQLSPSVGQNFIFQWDITSNIASIINSTLVQVGVTTGIWVGALQLGPDGKIYVSQFSESYLGIINNPELPGIQCNFIDSAISLNGHECQFGLPNFITSYFLPTGINTPIPYQNQLTISPNPATDKINISFPATASENITTKIYSITGEVVFEQINKSNVPITNYQLPITNISNGIYFLSVQTGREVVTGKIVVNH